MRKSVLTSVCALSLLIGATAAFAGTYGEPIDPEEVPVAPPPVAQAAPAPEIDYAATGPYLGVGGLYAINLFSDLGAGVSADDSGGLSVVGGYRFRPNFAFELAYENYFKFDLPLGDIEVWSLSANLKGYLLTGRWQPYALFGVGYLSGGSSAPTGGSHGDGTLLRFGAGMDAYITEHWSMGPEVAYGWPFGAAEDLKFVTVGAGVKYKF